MVCTYVGVAFSIAVQGPDTGVGRRNAQVGAPPGLVAHQRGYETTGSLMNVFDDWTGLLRVLTVGCAAYAALILFLRISGKRTLAKLNAFDLVVTVALGSTLSSVIVTKSVALLEGLLAFAVLMGAQYVIAALCVRFPMVGRLIKSDPRLLVCHGRLLDQAMREERVTVDEIRSIVRGCGYATLAEVGAVGARDRRFLSRAAVRGSVASIGPRRCERGHGGAVKAECASAPRAGHLAAIIGERAPGVPSGGQAGRVTRRF